MTINSLSSSSNNSNGHDILQEGQSILLLYKFKRVVPLSILAHHQKHTVVHRRPLLWPNVVQSTPNRGCLPFLRQNVVQSTSIGGDCRSKEALNRWTSKGHHLIFKQWHCAGGSWSLWPFGRSGSKTVYESSKKVSDKIQTQKLTPTAKQLASVNLAERKNIVTFTLSTSVLGSQKIIFGLSHLLIYRSITFLFIDRSSSRLFYTQGVPTSYDLRFQWMLANEKVLL
ncbi:hypothetical protein SSX86_033186 [Deinandra increscens subsp. villosa]|uniref:Uncharacterized protein n=1 Tax=Deinandra increscens subsp. villosa TaxID=3103831 RepID=A0AAP0C5S9_9ASTR